jgi:hypothetical protein
MSRLKVARPRLDFQTLLQSDEDGFRTAPQAVVQQAREAEMTVALDAAVRTSLVTEPRRAAI